MALSEPSRTRPAWRLTTDSTHCAWPGVMRETAEASSFVLEVPDELRPAFAYEAGQFCTFRVQVGGRRTCGATRCPPLRPSTPSFG